MTSDKSEIKNPHSMNYTFDVFKNLLTRMLESIHADKCTLIFPQKKGFKIEAEAIRTTKGIVAKSVFQLKSQNDKQVLLPESIINLVLETGQQIITDYPLQNKNFSSDEYLKQVNPSFVFCSPVVSESVVEGVLYLECTDPLSLNEQERATLLSLWAEQASLSLENTKSFLILQEDLRNRIHEISAVKKENKARIQFLADMNHEVMSTLNSIVGFSELLMKKDHQHHFPPDVKRYLENIQSSGNKLAELLDNVLEYSRIDTGNIELVRENIDIRILLNSIFLANRQLLSFRKVSLKIEVEEQCPNTIYCDRSVLTKVLMTLVKYSIHRSSSKNTVSLKVSKLEDCIQISLSDNGKPLSPRDQENLFLAFTYKNNRSHQCTSNMDDNLDLAISRQMVERMHGTVDYMSLKNKSAEIVVKIPCKNHVAVKDVMGAWKSDHSFTGEYRVLLLEDHLTNWDLLVNILKDLGLKIELEAISPTTLPKLVELNPQLMFIDMHMPGMDEQAKIFIRYLRSSKELKHVPVIAMTTDKYHNKYQSDYQSEGIEFLIKPFRVGDIVQVIKKHQHDLLVLNEQKSTKSGIKKANNLARILDSLPEQNNAMNLVFAKELEELSSIPIYKGGTIINRLNRIKETHKLSEGGNPSIIGNLKSAVYEGDAERFATIIKKALSTKLF